jgi:two-component system CheB/CheR fusion protein
MKKTSSKEKLKGNKKVTSSKMPNQNDFPIVGIGASAGGLEALEQFFKNVPDACGMAFVVIQHLDPNSKGMMLELIQRFTTMKVFTATDRITVKVNSIYIIPPNKNMAILNGSLHLFDPIAKHGLRLPIDYFLSSLADDRQDKSIGVILSGMGSDGSMGLKSIKEKEGFALVQSPSTAKFDSMPQSAIQQVAVDIVAPAIELPEKLLTILKRTWPKSGQFKVTEDESSIDKIIIQLRNRTGNDFSQYKKSTLYRRVERRMGIHLINKISDYVRYIQENPIEAEILFKELLIGVTAFFRDTAVWKHLKDSILPDTLTHMADRHVLRVWIPACSTGEEAYSFAIIFKEVVKKLNIENRISIQIFATDIDPQAVEHARKAVFPLSIESTVSKERIDKFFIKERDQYKVHSEIREMIVFATHNVIKDPPFTKLDFLSCRNMLIYMEADLQKKLISLFHYSLIEKGVLILGNAESINSLGNLFTTIESKLRIYKSALTPIKSTELFGFSSLHAKLEPQINIKPQKMTSENLETLTDKLLLQQLSPAGAIVTHHGDILYIVGQTGNYLEPAVGKADMNIFSMAREGIRKVLPGAIRRATKNYEKIVLTNIKANNLAQLVTITIQQIENPQALKDKLLILFSDEPLQEKNSTSAKTSNQKGPEKVSELEQELVNVSEELQNTIEEMNTSQEELKSTNEELQSTNEELQSTNEELTTSKEEMQSLNEELQTTNMELQSKMEDSMRISNDMNNLLNSGEIATLFLDKQFKIRHFTPAATKLFRLIPSDIGRLLTDLSTKLEYPTLLDDAQEVLRTLILSDKPIKSTNNGWLKVRIMPYRTFDDVIDGIVITLIDISIQRQLDLALSESQNAIRFFSKMESKVVIELSVDWKVIAFNTKAEQFFTMKRNDVISKDFFELTDEMSIDEKLKAGIKKSLNDNSSNTFKTNSKKNELKINWRAHKLYKTEGILSGFLITTENTHLD